MSSCLIQDFQTPSEYSPHLLLLSWQIQSCDFLLYSCVCSLNVAEPFLTPSLTYGAWVMELRVTNLTLISGFPVCWLNPRRLTKMDWEWAKLSVDLLSKSENKYGVERIISEEGSYSANLPSGNWGHSSLLKLLIFLSASWAELVKSSHIIFLPTWSKWRGDHMWFI